jgi:hypothetical protein
MLLLSAAIEHASLRRQVRPLDAERQLAGLSS